MQSGPQFDPAVSSTHPVVSNGSTTRAAAQAAFRIMITPPSTPSPQLDDESTDNNAMEIKPAHTPG